MIPVGRRCRVRVGIVEWSFIEPNDGGRAEDDGSAPYDPGMVAMGNCGCVFACSHLGVAFCNCLFPSDSNGRGLDSIVSVAAG